MEKAIISVIYNRKNKLNKNGKAIVQLEVKFHENKKLVRRYVSTNVLVEPKFWNEKKNEISAKLKDYHFFNLQIKEKIRLIEEHEKQLMINGKQLNDDELTYVLSKKENKDSFIEFCKNNLETDNKLSKDRKKSKKTLINKLIKFSPEITFNKLDYSFIKEFDGYLRGFDYKINYIANEHKILKSFINNAIKEDLIDKNPYDKFPIKQVPTKREHLTKEELEAFEKLDINHLEELNIARELFLFSCYTGIRFSDLMNLKEENINFDNESIDFNVGKTQKKQRLNLKLLFDGKPLIIVNKYKEENNLFPQYSNQDINRKLKVIAQMAEVKKRISFHISRHTFCTYIANKTGNPLLVKQLAGHTDIKTSMIYIYISNEITNKQLKKINW